MNFFNPYIEFYFQTDHLKKEMAIPFHKEVIWVFLNNLNNGLKIFGNRVNVKFVESPEKFGNQQFASIYEHRVYLDYDLFKKMPEGQKRQEILKVIHQAFTSLAYDYSWNQEPIDRAYLASKDNLDRFEYKTDPKLNKSRSTKGRILVSLQGDIVSFRAKFIDQKTNGNQVFRLLSTDEWHFSWWRKFKDFGWLDSNHFGLKLFNGELWIIVNKDHGELKTFFYPSQKSDLELKNELKSLLKNEK